MPGLSTSGTRNRATLTEPTKLISASAVKLYVTVVSRLNAAQVPIAHIVTATSVSSATSRSSVLGPASRRNIVAVAAPVSITPAMIQTHVMRDPPSLLARRSFGVRLLSVDGRQSASRSNAAINSRSNWLTWR